jgi:hypothetical protein
VFRHSRTVAAYVAAGASGLVALATLNVAADRLPQITGLSKFRDYLVRRNG